MNTKRSAIVGWVAYASAFIIGGGIGIYKYRYSPGGRKDQELEADRQRKEEAAREAEEEARIREERKKAKKLQELAIHQHVESNPVPALPASKAEWNDKHRDMG